jgi:hypothetical protein
MNDNDMSGTCIAHGGGGGGVCNAYRIYVLTPETEIPLGRPGRK